MKMPLTMKKMTKRILCTMMAGLFAVSAVPMNAFADENSTPKEEVVYVNLTGDGSVKDMYIVNIFDMDQNGKIVDYGNYESLRNMTGTEEIQYTEDKVEIDAQAGKLYYEGKASDLVMPWNIQVRYYLDGMEMSAKEIGGKSGELKIEIDIKKNEACEGNFFEAYALQATLKLNTNLCTNIIAEGATLANVGDLKQLTYTILPGNEENIVITADVKDFEMGAIAINGIRMNLSITIDTSKFQGIIDQVSDAVTALDGGAGSLEEGAAAIYGATGQLTGATSKLHDGVGSLVSGMNSLTSGLNTLTSNNDELTGGAMTAFKALCTAAESGLNEKLAANGFETVTLTPSTYEDALLSVLEEMDADAIYEQAFQIAREKVTAEVEARAEEVYRGYLESEAESIYKTYLQSQADALYTMVVKQVLTEQLMAEGYTEAEAKTYLEEDSWGKIKVAYGVRTLTDDQKQQILDGAYASLTDDQKQQILDGAYASLTADQKRQIREGYIEQMMESEEVTSQINDAVKQVNSAAAQITELLGNLKNYETFYNGLVEYTKGVSQAASGAHEISDGIATLFDNTDLLKSAVGELHLGVGKLNDGTGQLKNGTGEFVANTSGIGTKVDQEIDSMTSSLTGKDVKVTSFTSEKNENIKSVQFVIQAEGVETPETVEEAPQETEKLTFWQKLLRLFGLY
ncbi:MAG: hypothetical protein E7253_03230 [Lachnospiraceae bacterium]|nr:hypothetical protein [Lachnospiraceae bacterium]